MASLQLNVCKEATLFKTPIDVKPIEFGKLEFGRQGTLRKPKPRKISVGRARKAA